MFNPRREFKYIAAQLVTLALGYFGNDTMTIAAFVAIPVLAYRCLSKP